MQVNDIVTFAPRAGETAEGIVTRVWDKPASDPYVTVRTTEDEGRTFVRCSSALEKCGCWNAQHLGSCIHAPRPGA